MMSKVINLKANNSSIYDDITQSYFSYYNGPFPVELHKTPFGKEEYMYKSNGYVYLSTPSNIQSIIRNLESFTISFWTILTSSTVGAIISFASSSVYRYGFFISTIFNIYKEHWPSHWDYEFKSESKNEDSWNYIEIYFDCLNNSTKQYIISISVNGKFSENKYDFQFGYISGARLLTWLDAPGNYGNQYNSYLYDFSIHDNILHTKSFSLSYYNLFDSDKNLYGK